MTPKVPAGADLKRSETGVSEKNLRCISGTSAFRISRYQHYWRRKTTFLSLLRTFLVVERNLLLKNCGFLPLVNHPLSLKARCARKGKYLFSACAQLWGHGKKNGFHPRGCRWDKRARIHLRKLSRSRGQARGLTAATSSQRLARRVPAARSGTSVPLGKWDPLAN